MIGISFRTTTLTEELGQIEYIFSDKVNSKSPCSVQGGIRGDQAAQEPIIIVQWSFSGSNNKHIIPSL